MRDLPTYRTPDEGDAAQAFSCRLAYALTCPRALDAGPDEDAKIRPLYLALLCDEGARRPIDAALRKYGYLELQGGRDSPRRLEVLRSRPYRRAFQRTGAGPSMQTYWLAGYFEVEPFAGAGAAGEDEPASPRGPLVRLCSMPALADLRAAPDLEVGAARALELGLEGPPSGDPRREHLGAVAVWWAALLDRRTAAPLLQDPAFRVQLLLAAARSSAENGMLLSSRSSHPAAAQWAGRVGRGWWGRAPWSARDPACFADYGSAPGRLGLAEPILTVARDDALRYLVARELRAFEAAARGGASAYAESVAASESGRLSQLLAEAEAARSRKGESR